jgi:hypothetical protein
VNSKQYETDVDVWSELESPLTSLVFLMHAKDYVGPCLDFDAVEMVGYSHELICVSRRVKVYGGLLAGLDESLDE